MNTIKKIATVFFLLIAASTFAQTNLSFPQAKFKTGDQPDWKNLDFDDSQWPMIKTTERWEEQGYAKYDGFAWYRFRFVLPVEIKKDAYWKDSLSFLLSRIDDADETFLNGVLIGKTGLFASDAGGPLGQWQVNRVYTIPADSKLINWGKENVIAIRVSDFSGGGGMLGNVPSVKMMAPIDVLELTLDADEVQPQKYNAVIKNTSRKTIEGVWTITIKEGESKVVKTVTKALVLSPMQQVKETVTASPGMRQQIESSFKEKLSGSNKSVLKVTPYILTPQPSKMPRINSPSVFGVRPGSPLLFKVAATGAVPLKYSAVKLPKGLSIDNNTGIISGKIESKGNYEVQLTVANKWGNATQKFTIKAGDQLALTPPMGWNSWNSWGLSVSDEKVKSSAQAIIDKGLINHGWSYINLDDGWESATRKSDGSITGNDKFPDMISLGDWLHTNGLKFGIYSSPGTKTCGGYLGTYQHEAQDAATYSNWGIDYLKYDWCSYDDVFYHAKDSSLEAYQKPYKVMEAALQQQPRDIVYSLCQYGMKDVWKWGAKVNGNLWRTTGDIRDTWESMKSIGFGQAPYFPYVSPGHWNDPDMLVVGQVGWSAKLRPTRLTPDEQYSHISLWCLLSAPLLIGADASKMDDFTLSLLTNDEVLAIDQDVLGKQAVQKIKTNDYEVWVKDLADGSKAIGLFNMNETYQDVQFSLKEIGLNGNYQVRDLWRQKNEGIISSNYSSKLPPHGVTLIKLLKK